MADDIGKRLEILSRDIRSEAILSRISTLVMQIIEERTLRGEFLRADSTAYSAGHAKKRQQRNLQTQYVDLQFSGATWGSFASDVDVREAEINLGFNRDELAKIASYHDLHGAGINKVRHEFLGLSDNELQRVHDFMLQEMGNAIDVTMNKDLPEL